MSWITDSAGNSVLREIPERMDYDPDNRPPRLFCTECDCEIADGEEYYDIAAGAHILCENCMNEARRYAGVEY